MSAVLYDCNLPWKWFSNSILICPETHINIIAIPRDRKAVLLKDSGKLGDGLTRVEGTLLPHRPVLTSGHWQLLLVCTRHTHVNRFSLLCRGLRCAASWIVGNLSAPFSSSQWHDLLEFPPLAHYHPPRARTESHHYKPLPHTDSPRANKLVHFSWLTPTDLYNL